MIELNVATVGKMFILIAIERCHLVYAVGGCRTRVNPLLQQNDFGVRVDGVNRVGEGGLVVISVDVDIAVASDTLRIGHVRKGGLPAVLTVTRCTIGDI